MFLSSMKGSTKFLDFLVKLIREVRNPKISRPRRDNWLRVPFIKATAGGDQAVGINSEGTRKGIAFGWPLLLE